MGRGVTLKETRRLGGDSIKQTGVIITLDARWILQRGDAQTAFRLGCPQRSLPCTNFTGGAIGLLPTA